MAEQFPPWDGVTPIDIWKARRAEEIRVAYARRSKMLDARGPDGRPLYRLTATGNLRRTRRLSRRTRRSVIARDGGKCTRCGSSRWLEVDHIVRYIDGGSDEMSNLRTLCEPCHRRRKDR